MTRAEIALLLTQARVSCGLTQAQLALAMGTTQPAVARAESGYRMPTIDFIDRWARATGRPLLLTLGATDAPASSRKERRQLVRSVLGRGRFNPWDRQPSRVEADLLRRAGMDREFFEGRKSSPARRAN